MIDESEVKRLRAIEAAARAYITTRRRADLGKSSTLDEHKRLVKLEETLGMERG